MKGENLFRKKQKHLTHRSFSTKDIFILICPDKTYSNQVFFYYP